MARLQELQYTVTGGSRVVSGVSLSPRSARGYLRTSLRCKQESLRMHNVGARSSPPGKSQGNTIGEWRRTSLPVMLLEETVLEILQASQFAKDVVGAASKLSITRTKCDPQTPDSFKRTKKSRFEDTNMRARRMREKQTIQSDRDTVASTRARSRITFKPKSPPYRRETRSTNIKTVQCRRGNTSSNTKAVVVAKKTVLFPNPLFHSSNSQPKFYKSRTPIIPRIQKQRTPHKFLIKTPPSSLKSQFKSKKAMAGTGTGTVLFLSPEKKATPPKARRCSFSPSKLASKLMSPLKNRISPMKARVQKSGNKLVSGLKQRPVFGSPMSGYSGRRT